MIAERWYIRTIEQIEKQFQNYSNKTNLLLYKQIIIVTEKDNYMQIKKL